MKEYNAKQTREDRKISDYFSHVTEKQQDMAVEIIFQVGDKKYWEKHYFERTQINTVYKLILEKLQELLPDFVVANAVVHYDESSPHMHVVGVPVGRNFKRGLSVKVSKRSVFTQDTLSKVLQGELRDNAEMYVKRLLDAGLKEKQKGRSHDLTVAEYKVKQETEKVKELNSILKSQREINRNLCDKQDEIENENQKLYREQKRLKEANNDLEDKILKNKFEQKYLEEKCEEAKEKIGQLDKLLEVLDKLKRFIKLYLPFAPLIEEFANKVESGQKELEEGNSITGYRTSLGKLMESFKEKFYEHFYWFTRLMRWNTSKGDVASVYRDALDNGDCYEIKGYADVKNKETYRVKDLQVEIKIKTENRVGMPEQIEENIEVVEMQVRVMREEEKQEKELKR